MPAVARWVAVPARPRRCVRAASGQGRGRGGGGYRQRAGGVLRDPYDTLGVATDASQAEVKLAFRKLVRTYHPDVNPDENAAARFRRINAAYEIVGDVERRRRFDLGQDWEVRPRTLRPKKTIHDPSLSIYSPEPNLSTHSVPTSQAMDDGWMPEAETKARARATAYDPNAARSPKEAQPRRTRKRTDVALNDAERRKEGMNEVYRARFRRCWDVWCRLWMAGLNVGVPVASAYFVAVGLMHERLPLFR